MLLKENATEQKLRGSYYTSNILAEYTAAWALSEIKANARVLEPSCGDGVFLPFLDMGVPVNVLGIEVEGDEAKKAANRIPGSRYYESLEAYFGDPEHKCSGHRLSVICDDFYKVYREKLIFEKFDCIVGNPPYIRYQYLTAEQRDEQNEILIQNGLKSNKLINAWVSFVVACINLLNPEGKIGFVIPAELLQVAYATDLRAYITSQLSEITIVTFEELVFSEVEQETVVLLGKKRGPTAGQHRLRIVQYKNAEELVKKDDLDQHEFKEIGTDEGKWTKFFLSGREQDLIEEIKSDNRFKLFKELAKAEVGITTGNNDYFCVNADTVSQYDLAEVSLPLVARSVNVAGIEFKKSDWEMNVKNGAKTYLLDFNGKSYEDLSEGQRSYIEKGESEEQHTGYKCRIREKWYQVPSIWRPDAFFLRRNYLYPKFVLNCGDVNAVSTDTMHRVTMRAGTDARRMIISYYNSISFAFTELEGRSYGGGVLEILPGEVGNVLVPDMQKNTTVDDATVNQIFDQIDHLIRENEEVEKILDVVDTQILGKHFKMNRDTVLEFRAIWKKLQTRRLARGRRLDFAN